MTRGARRDVVPVRAVSPPAIFAMRYTSCDGNYGSFHGAVTEYSWSPNVYTIGLGPAADMLFFFPFLPCSFLSDLSPFRGGKVCCRGFFWAESKRIRISKEQIWGRNPFFCKLGKRLVQPQNKNACPISRKINCGGVPFSGRDALRLLAVKETEQGLGDGRAPPLFFEA